MDEFVSRGLVCPVCNTAFLVEVPAGVRVVGEESDFRPVVEGPDPLCLDVHACPLCRYAGFAEAFFQPPDPDEELIDRAGLPEPLAKMLPPADEQLDGLRSWIRRGGLTRETGLAAREPSPAERWWLAARCRDHLGDPTLAVADLQLRGAWCARATGDPFFERELLEEAFSQIGAALDEESLDAAERLRWTYLAAEISRRVGAFGRAVDLFGRVESEADVDEEEGQLLYRLARRMGALARARVDLAARMPTAEELEAEPLPGDEDDDEEE